MATTVKLPGLSGYRYKGRLLVDLNDVLLNVQSVADQLAENGDATGRHYIEGLARLLRKYREQAADA